MTTDNGSSRSQADVHADVRDDVVKADADLICEDFTDGPGRWLTEWNFPGAAVPKVWRLCEAAEDLKARADRDRVLFDMGFKPTPEYVDDTYGEGFVEKDAAPAVDTPPPAAGSADASFAEGAADPIDGVVDTALDDDWEPLMRPRLDAVDALLDDCVDLVEFRDRLGEIAAAVDPAELAEHLGRRLLVARLEGQLGLDAGSTRDG